MALKKIQLRPGIFREGTNYANQGGWYDCDKIRFRSSFPEKMKGWVKNTSSQFIGTCRALIAWGTLSGQNYVGLGTTSKYYVQISSGGAFIDITPIRTTSTLAATNLISVNNGSAAIFIRDTVNADTAIVGDYVNIANAITVGGITAANINTQTGWVITHVFSDTAPIVLNPITTTNGTKTISVAWAGNTLEVGNLVSIAGLTGVSIGGITIAEMTGVFPVTGILTSGSTVTGFTYSVPTTNASSTASGGGNTYTIGVDDIKVTVGAAATSTTTGGTQVSPATTLSYQLQVGLNVPVTGDGWGAGPWSRGGWGSAYGNLTPTSTLRLWSHDTFGQDLIINVRDGGIYYETQASIAASTVTAPVRAVNLTDLAGANNPPTVSREVAVSGSSRHVIAFACNPYGETDASPMLIRWSSAEDVADWQPRETNTAGDIVMATGSQFITQIQAKQQIVIWTDISMYALDYVGAPYYFGLQQIGYGTSIIGPGAKSSVDDSVYWMGSTAFYRYNGRIEQLNCTVKDYIFSRLNTEQNAKIVSGTNLALGEVMWFYVSNSSPGPDYPIDSYVTYNYLQDIWYYGSLSRTAWLDFAQSGNPIAAGEDFYLYNHEIGNDDGSTNPATPITAYIESSPFEIEDGDSFVFVRQIFPDLTFNNSTSASPPTATFTISGYNYPGAGVTDPTSINGFGPDTAAVTAVSTSELNQFTQQISLRMRARSVAVKLSSDGLGVAWRFGAPRFEVRTDGRR